MLRNMKFLSSIDNKSNLEHRYIRRRGKCAGDSIDDFWTMKLHYDCPGSTPASNNRRLVTLSKSWWIKDVNGGSAVDSVMARDEIWSIQNSELFVGM